PANWYLQGRLGRTYFMQSLSDHKYPFVKYTNNKQRLLPEIDDLAEIDRIVALDRNGAKWEGDVGSFSELSPDAPKHAANAVTPLRVETSEPHDHTVVSHDRFARFRYISRRGFGDDDSIEIHIIEELDTFDIAEACRESNARFVAAVESGECDELTDILVSRLHIISACESVNVRYNSGHPTLPSPGILAPSSRTDDNYNDASLSFAGS